MARGGQAPKQAAAKAAKAAKATKDQGVVVCDACPVLCRIRPGKTGACDRYGNIDGALARMDPMILAQKTAAGEGAMVPFLTDGSWDGRILPEGETFVTGIGSGTTYPDYKPAPFIVASRHDEVDMVTVVSEGIFSYCGLKVKIDTDRFIGPETAPVRCRGEQVGHVTTAEYGSQMLALGGVRHITGGSKKEGNVTCQMMLALCNKGAVELSVDGGAEMTIEAGKPPVIGGVMEERMRVGCGSATIGMFAKQWHGNVDEVIVVDDHITGVLTEHQAGRFLGMAPGGIRVRGRRSTPGRYFQVAEPGDGWGGTDVTDPLAIIDKIDADVARPGERLLMVSTTGEDAAYFVLDDDLRPAPAEMPAAVGKVVERIGENCEPALASVLFMAGAGGSLRAGVTENPVRLTRSVRAALTRVTCGGAPVYVWPGGGITLMVDVTRMPDDSFGFVPTPAIVGPIEFSMRREDYAELGGHVDAIRDLSEVSGDGGVRVMAWPSGSPWPLDRDGTDRDGTDRERQGDGQGERQGDGQGDGQRAGKKRNGQGDGQGAGQGNVTKRNGQGDGQRDGTKRDGQGNGKKRGGGT